MTFIGFFSVFVIVYGFVTLIRVINKSPHFTKFAWDIRTALISTYCWTLKATSSWRFLSSSTNELTLSHPRGLFFINFFLNINIWVICGKSKTHCFDYINIGNTIYKMWFKDLHHLDENVRLRVIGVKFNRCRRQKVNYFKILWTVKTFIARSNHVSSIVQRKLRFMSKLEKRRGKKGGGGGPWL